MLKRKLFCCMVLVLVVVSITACAGGEPNDVCKGIHISTTEQEDSWEEDGHRIIIKKDGVTLSGTAESDLRIVCREDVSSLELKNLVQGDHVIHLSPNGLDSKEFQIIIRGENRLQEIASAGSVFIKGADATSSLNLDDGVRTHKDLVLKDVTVRGGYFKSFRNMKIMGHSQLYAENRIEGTDHSLTAKVQARKKLSINLEEEGMIAIKKTDGILPIHGRPIELDKDNKIAEPQNAVLKKEDSIDGPNSCVIENKDGSFAKEVKIVPQQKMQNKQSES